MRLLPALVMAPAVSLAAIGANAATTSCSSVAACVMGTNSSSGSGVGGTSKSGFGLSGISTSGHGVNGASSSSFGVVGITTQNATSIGTARAGVFGEDLSTNQNALDSGVAGSSTYGYGVTGTTGYGGAYGGKFTGGAGVFTTGLDVDAVQALHNPNYPTGQQLTGGGGISMSTASTGIPAMVISLPM